MKPNKDSIEEIDLNNQSSPALPWNVFKCSGSISNLNTLDSFKVRRRFDTSLNRPLFWKIIMSRYSKLLYLISEPK